VCVCVCVCVCARVCVCVCAVTWLTYDISRRYLSSLAPIRVRVRRASRAHVRVDTEARRRANRIVNH